MAGPYTVNTESYRYYDVVNSGQNILAPYQAVSLLTAAEITSQSADEGVGIRPSDPAGTSFLDRVIGISHAAAKHNTQVPVAVSGIALVMISEAVAYGAPLFSSLREQRLNSAAPLINLFEMNIPMEPGVNVTYNLSMVNDTTVTAQSGSANVMQRPVGYALETGSAKYQLVRTKLETAIFYA